MDEIELEGEGFWLDQAPELDLLYSAEQTSLWLTFWSDESGTFEGELTFYSDDPDGPLTLELSGQSWGSLDDEENAEY